MVTTITEVLNIWNEMGVFSYVIPFLLIFAVVFAILSKTKILGEERPLMGIVSAAIGLLSLQFDIVSEFFAIVFPRFGVGLSIFLVALIFIGFFSKDASEKSNTPLMIVGIVVAVGTVIWSFGSWNAWTSGVGVGGWFAENFWGIFVLGVIIGVIVAVMKGKPSEAG